MASPLHPGLPHPVRSTFRVSRPPGGLLLATAADHLSGRCAHGVPSLQSFSLARSTEGLSTSACPPAVHRCRDDAESVRSTSPASTSLASSPPRIQMHSSSLTASAETCASGPTSGPCSPGRVRHTPPDRLKSAGLDALLGFGVLFRVSPPPPFRRRPHRPEGRSGAPPPSTSFGPAHQLAPTHDPGPLEVCPEWAWPHQEDPRAEARLPAGCAEPKPDACDIPS
jgi:hypothetical protein